MVAIAHGHSWLKLSSHYSPKRGHKLSASPGFLYSIYLVALENFEFAVPLASQPRGPNEES